MVWRALLARLGISLVTLWVVSVLIFIGTNLLPGDIAQIILGQMATPENTAVLREKLGLDKHPLEQYLVWLSNVVMGDLGISKAGLGAGLGTPIVEMLGPRIDNTAMLTILVGAIAIPISVALGLLAATGSHDYFFNFKYYLDPRFFNRYYAGAGVRSFSRLAAFDRLFTGR